MLELTNASSVRVDAHGTSERWLPSTPLPARIAQPRFGDSSDGGGDSVTDDRALALRIQDGDERAFQDMYRAYAPLILRRLSRWIGDTQQAEDCLQQVFLEALRSIDKYRGEGKLSGWLNRIATHVVMDMFRQKKRVKNLMERVMPEQRVAIAEDDPGIPEEMFFQEELRELVHEILNKLSAQKRMAILLCDLEGMPLEEAASQMGVPLGTVGSRLYHGRREFQKRARDELRRRGLSIEDVMP